jgi:hypothetical protein
VEYKIYLTFVKNVGLNVVLFIIVRKVWACYSKLQDFKSPPLYLCNNPLDYDVNGRYLGIKIETCYSCKSDRKRQLCQFYANANMFIRKFSFCSDDVKVHLFKSYCTNLYCTQLIMVWFFCSVYEKTICRL